MHLQGAFHLFFDRFNYSRNFRNEILALRRIFNLVITIILALVYENYENARIFCMCKRR